MTLMERTRRSVYLEDSTTGAIIRQLSRAGVELDVAIPVTAWFVRRMLRGWRAAGVS